MILEIPEMIIPLLLISWLAQLRLCRGMQGDEYRRERAFAQYGGLACLGLAIVCFVLQFFF